MEVDEFYLEEVQRDVIPGSFSSALTLRRTNMNKV